MGDIMIKLEDATLLEALSEMAKANNRSVESEVRQLLTKAVDERHKRLEFYRRAQAISAMTPKGVVQTDSTLLIRADRDR
ncbi:MAG: hypothetical protein JNL61_00250 [Rhizobiaceae bacterium]|nr:hypothetical protein [Rhizobiaceae bacterium]